MSARRLAFDTTADPKRFAPGPAVARCAAPGCREYTSCGVYQTSWCWQHKPADFLDAAREHSRQVRAERGAL